MLPDVFDVWCLLQLPTPSKVTDQSPACYLDCPGPLLGCRYNRLANTGGQTQTVVP